MNNPGQLNRRIVLESPVETPDDAGGAIRDHGAAETLWASVTPLSAREQFEAAQRGANVTHRIVMRFREGLSTRHRLRLGAHLFRIVSWRDPDGSARFVEIAASERVA